MPVIDMAPAFGFSGFDQRLRERDTSSSHYRVMFPITPTAKRAWLATSAISRVALLVRPSSGLHPAPLQNPGAVVPRGGLWYLQRMAEMDAHGDARSPAEDRRDRGRRVLAATVVAALLLSAAVLAVVWAQMGRALEVGQTVLDRTDAVTATLNEDIAAFKGTAATAKKIQPRLKAGQQVLNEQVGPIDRMVGIGPIVVYRERLRSYVTSASDYYDDVLSTATFVADRSQVVQEIGRAFEALSQAATATTSADVIAKADEAAQAAGAAVSRLQSMSASSTAAYVNTALIAHLGELRAALAELAAGLTRQNASAIRRSGARLGQLLKADWESLFYEADASTIARFKAQAADLQGQRQEIMASRLKLEQQRPLLGVSVVVLLLVSALIAAAVWLR